MDTHATRRPHHFFRLPARLLAVGVLAFALVCGSAAPPATAMSPQLNTLADVVNKLGGWQAGSINQYWYAQFRSWGMTWTAPSVRYYGNWTGGHYWTPCWHTSTQMNNGFYCPGDNGVSLDYWYLQDFIDAGGRYALGDYGAGGFLAHEFGHRVQHLLGNGRMTGDFRAEYNADCLAGMYTRWAYASGVLTGGDYWEFDAWLRSQTTTKTHGSGLQRAGWFYQGYAYQSFATCDRAYAATS